MTSCIMLRLHVCCTNVLRVGALCAMRRAPQLLEKHMQAAAALVLGVFQEQHAGAHPNMWEMVLAFVKAYPSAWHAVDMRKAVLPRLLAFLRSHTNGFTHTVCLASNIVPMFRLRFSICMCCPDCWPSSHPCLYSYCLPCKQGCPRVELQCPNLLLP